MLNALGNSLMGMFASEHLAHKFPLLPTETLKMALTAYVGPVACVSVARELGVGVRGGADAGLIGKGRGSFAAGIPVRWKRNSVKVPRIPISSRFRQFKEVEPTTSRTASASGDASGDAVVDPEYEAESSSSDRNSPAVQEEKVTFDKVVAATVRAFIGLIYQEQVSAGFCNRLRVFAFCPSGMARASAKPRCEEARADGQGIHAARRFVEAHFLTRHLDLASLFSFKHPKKVLSTVIQRHLTEAGVRAGDRTGYIVTR
jgi:large subunit ribosomal protein L44